VRCDWRVVNFRYCEKEKRQHLEHVEAPCCRCAKVVREYKVEKRKVWYVEKQVGRKTRYALPEDPCHYYLKEHRSSHSVKVQTDLYAHKSQEDRSHFLYAGVESRMGSLC
jgi:hypothetical protein